MTDPGVIDMNFPIHFPDDADVIAAEAARFRALSPEEQLQSIREVIATGDFLIRNSPKAALLRAQAEEEEDRFRQAVREFIARHTG